MAQSSTKKKPIGTMIVMGIISLALYTTLLLKQDLLNSTFAKGGWYALLPIVMAFVFSYFHGSFTGHFWTVLGIEAARKKKEVK
jgi:hypothetical protein